MQRNFFTKSFFSIPDIMVFLLIATLIFGVIAINNAWRAEFQPVTPISLSFWALPKYTILSGARGMVAYFISLGFTLWIGYIAAKSKTAEKILIPMLDILQSIPVLGFLPGLVLGLIAIFPRTNIGLELAAILMIFTGQVWNMTFSYYSSLKSIPHDFEEASTMIGLGWLQKLRYLELPFSAVNLAWNSLMSMAGGWFFLSVCEAFTLGDREFRLPGIGAYMATAINAGDMGAMIMGVVAMILLIVAMDFFLWRPIMSWAKRFRLEDVPGVQPGEPLMAIMLRESKIFRFSRMIYYRYLSRRLRYFDSLPKSTANLSATLRRLAPESSPLVAKLKPSQLKNALKLMSFIIFILFLIWGTLKLIGVLRLVPWSIWIVLGRNAFWSLLRVMISLVISTIWAVPVGIWIGTSFRRISVAQPIIQVLASFPAPMLYPLALTILFAFNINFEFASMCLMLLGVQWYILFNVLAGAMRVPQELNDALSLMNNSTLDRWRALYIPSVFPALVTGWVTAAGGAWNASIVAETLKYKGTTLTASGLGASISMAAESGNFPMLAASLLLMVVIVVLLNRVMWAPFYRLVQTRYKLET